MIRKLTITAIMGMCCSVACFLPRAVNAADHWINEVDDGGALIVLENDSVWGVNPVDRVKSELWLTTTQIDIYKSNDSSYPYVLVDTDDNESVHVKYMGIP